MEELPALAVAVANRLRHEEQPRYVNTEGAIALKLYTGDTPTQYHEKGTPLPHGDDLMPVSVNLNIAGPAENPAAVRNHPLFSP